MNFGLDNLPAIVCRIEQWAIDNNLIPDLSSVSGKIPVQFNAYFFSESMHRCQFKNNVCALILLIVWKLSIESVKIACGESLKSLNSVKRWETHYRPFTSLQHEGWKEQMAIIRPYPNKKWSKTRWKWSSLIYALYVKTWNAWLTLSHDYTLLHVHVCCPLWNVYEYR